MKSYQTTKYQLSFNSPILFISAFLLSTLALNSEFLLSFLLAGAKNHRGTRLHSMSGQNYHKSLNTELKGAKRLRHSVTYHIPFGYTG